MRTTVQLGADPKISPEKKNVTKLITNRQIEAVSESPARQNQNTDVSVSEPSPTVKPSEHLVHVFAPVTKPPAMQRKQGLPQLAASTKVQQYSLVQIKYAKQNWI